MGSTCCGESGAARSPPMSESAYLPVGCLFSKVVFCDTIVAEGPARRRATAIARSPDAARLPSLEAQLKELFSLHDLNSDGVLEEAELVQLNAKVAMLHHGKQADLDAVKVKYRTLFREKLDARGRPVPYDVFRRYLLQVLDAMDPNPMAQEMIMEQFAEEAKAARAVFRAPSFASVSDTPFLPPLPATGVAEELRSPVRCNATLRGEQARLLPDLGFSPGRRRLFPCRQPSTDSGPVLEASFGGA